MSEDQNLQEEATEEKPENAGETDETTPLAEVSEQSETPDQEPNIVKSEIQIMEVHKHPHDIMHKKSWKEYLLEFVMLFLAVFLGFIAENTRQHLVEKNEEKEYVRSLIDDIRADTANAQAVINDFQNRLPHLDTMINSFGDLMRGRSGTFSRNIGFIGGFKDFYITDGTMQQLKNAGGLRLIRNKTIADSILRYDGTTKVLSIQQNFLDNNTFIPLWHLQGTLFDTYKLDSLHHIPNLQNETTDPGDILLTHDRQNLIQYYSSLTSLRFDFVSWMNQLSAFKNDGTRLIDLLQKGYHFKDE